MSALPMIRDWREQVWDELLPDLHRHQVNALADLSFALALSSHCHSGKLTAVAPGDTTPAVTKRRLERLLTNDRLDPESVGPQLARAVLAGSAGGPVVLILNETPNRNDLRCLKLTAAYPKRALLVWSACYVSGGPPEPIPDLVRRLPRRAAACPRGSRSRS